MNTDNKQPEASQSDFFVNYLKGEKDQQIPRLKALGINTEDQFFEQAINGVIMMAESPNGWKRARAIAFAEWMDSKTIKFEGDYYLLEDVAPKQSWAECQAECETKSLPQLYDLFMEQSTKK